MSEGLEVGIAGRGSCVEIVDLRGGEGGGIGWW